MIRILFFILCLLSASSTYAQSVQVTTKAFGDVAIYPQREAFATVISLNDSRIAAEVTARIVEIPVEVGQVVPKDAILARLDSRDYVLAVERAAATLESARSANELAKQQLERAQKLVEEGFLSPESLDQRESNARTAAAQLKAAQAELATARRNVRKCLVRAPFKAIIKERIGQVGEIATPGTALVRALDAGRIEVSARVQPDYVAALKASERITLESRAGSLNLKLHRVVPALNPRERNQEVRFRFTGKSAMPGTAGRVVWQSAQGYFPPDLVLRRGGQLGVFVADGNTATFVPLPLAQEGRPAPADFDASTNIILVGRHQLQHGDRISLLPQQ